jgi:hypothetical protein
MTRLERLASVTGKKMPKERRRHHLEKGRQV